MADSIQYGLTASAINRKYGPRFLRITDIQDGRVNWSEVPSCDIPKADIPKYRLSSGDLVFARTGATTGKSFLIGDCPEAVFASYLIRVRVSADVDSRYLSAFFQSPDYWRQIEDGKRGIGQPNVNGTVLGEVQFPVAPLHEQRRIVAEIEKQFTRLDAGVAALRRVQANLKRYRAAVLKAACEGRLVSSSVKWPRRKLGELTSKIGSGSTPRGGADVYRDAGIPLIRSMNVHSTGFRFDGLAHIDETEAEKLDHVTVEAGDVLLNITGASIGRVTTAPASLDGARVNQHVCIIRPNQGLVSAFLAIFLASPIEQARVLNVQVGATRQALTKSMIVNWEVPVPPLAEQTRIVAEVERRLSVVEELETVVTANLQRTIRLRQSILQEAFTGNFT
jgi:type I restriction enzyme S subunit